MKRILFPSMAAIATVLAVVALSFTGCTGSGQGDKTAQTSDQPAQDGEKQVQYTCSMHPEVVQGKPGDCPKCGMKLVEKR